MKIVCEYSGEYPNLCAGHLFVTIDGKKWDFGEHVLESGGSVWFDEEWCEYVTSGPWTIDEWPEDFPEDLKDAVTDAINDQVRYGCCGGCV